MLCLYNVFVWITPLLPYRNAKEELVSEFLMRKQQYWECEN